MSESHGKHLSVLILSALFIGTSGALGKYIAMPTPVIIWFRSSIGMVALFLFCKSQHLQFVKLQPKERLPFLTSALFLGGHWITYFLSLKASNVAIGMLSLFTFPVMTALLEPFFGKEKFKPMHVFLAVLILIGIYILAPVVDYENTYFKGILLGLLSALFYSIRVLIVKQFIGKLDSSILMFYQLAILSVVLIPVLFVFDISDIQTQYPYILFLGLVTTALGHTLFVRSLKYFSAATASIIASIQPIFGILIAIAFLGEIPTLNTIFGGSLILLTVLIESYMSKKS
ncbi:EamA family transporter [Urechidicola sp. KH5]